MAHKQWGKKTRKKLASRRSYYWRRYDQGCWACQSLRERERERERENLLNNCVCVCVCVCERERERVMAGGTSSVQLLYVWASPFAMRVELALAFKGVEYEKLPQDLRSKSQLLLDSNPVHKKIPVLIHDGKPVCESGIIVQYVDEAWPSPDGINLLPADPYEKAIARFWADFVDQKVLDALFKILKTKGEDQKVAIENAMVVMATLEEGLGGVAKELPFFGGSNVGFVDIMVGPLLAWLPVFEDMGNFTFPFEEKYPCLHGWLLAFKAHPLSSILPEPPKVIDFISQLFRPKDA